MREAGVKTKMVEALRKRGLFVKRLAAGPHSVPGLPDILVIIPPTGRAAFIEAKTEKAYRSKGNGLSLPQAQTLMEASAAGAVAICCCTVTQMWELLGPYL